MPGCCKASIPKRRIEEHYERIIRGDSRITADQLFAKQYHAGARVLAEAFGIQGICTTVAPPAPRAPRRSRLGRGHGTCAAGCGLAAGLIEAIASVVCAEQGVLPPTANFSEPREGCMLDYVPAAGRPWNAPRTFLSHNAAFGGHNASLALALPGELPAPPPDRSCADPICITAIGLVSSLGLGVAALIERVVGQASSLSRAGFQRVNPPKNTQWLAQEPFDVRCWMLDVGRSVFVWVRFMGTASGDD